MELSSKAGNIIKLLSMSVKAQSQMLFSGSECTRDTILKYNKNLQMKILSIFLAKSDRFCKDIQYISNVSF